METKELFSQAENFESDVFDFDQYRIGYFIKKNIEKSPENEDSLFFYGEKDNLVLGVSDGVGGYPRGKDASQLASQGIINYFKKHHFKETHFLRNVEKINLKIRELKVGAKTTLTAGLIQKYQLKLYSIGDSEALLANTKGQLIYSNIPQSPVGYGVEAGYIDQSDALDDPDRHLVNHLLGDEVLRFEASSQISFKKGYSLLIGTDGLFDNIYQEKVLGIIGGGSFDESFSEIVKFCTDLPDSDHWRKDDDISFLFVRRVRSE